MNPEEESSTRTGIDTILAKYRDQITPYLDDCDLSLRERFRESQLDSLRRYEDELVRFTAETGRPHYDVVSLDLPESGIWERDDRGPLLLGPRAWGCHLPPSTMESIFGQIGSLNRWLYNDRANGVPPLESIQRYFYSGIGGINNRPDEDHPIFREISQGNEGGCWEVLRRLGVEQREGKLLLSPATCEHLNQFPSLISGQHTYGFLENGTKIFDNVENLRSRETWGDSFGVTYLATRNIDYFTVPEEQNHFVRIVIDTHQLLRCRNVFADPESFSHTEEFGISFFVFGGIPKSAIISIDGMEPDTWLSKVSI